MATRTPTARDYKEAATLREALRRFARRSEMVTRASGLTPRVYQLLLFVKTARDGTEAAGLSELEDRLQLGKSTVTELVLRCEDRGLVRRELDPNRRNAVRVRLTPSGERKLARALAGLSGDRARLLRLLRTNLSS
jgi:DNA-binding MarR family transcriptional regulator